MTYLYTLIAFNLIEKYIHVKLFNDNIFHKIIQTTVASASVKKKNSK